MMLLATRRILHLGGMKKRFPAPEKLPADAIVASDCAMINHEGCVTTH